jgi:hypothetical protein
VCLLQLSLAQPLISIVIHHRQRPNSVEGKWVSEWLWMSECEWESVSGWLNVSEWVSECEWVRECEWVSEREWVSESVCEWVSEWVSECEEWWKRVTRERRGDWLSVQGGLYVSQTIHQKGRQWLAIHVCVRVCVWECDAHTCLVAVHKYTHTHTLSRSLSLTCTHTLTHSSTYYHTLRAL